MSIPTRDTLDAYYTKALQDSHPVLEDWNVKVQYKSTKGFEHYCRTVHILHETRVLTIPASYGPLLTLSTINDYADRIVEEIHFQALQYDRWLEARLSTLLSALKILSRERPNALATILKNQEA